jgi:hypothetical protein
MPMLIAFFGTWDLVIIAFIALLLFGNRLPTMMRDIGQGWVESRCPHCGWWSISLFRCMHCGRAKFPQVISKTLVEPAAAMGDGQTNIRLPIWLLILLSVAGAAWAADWIGSSIAGLSSVVIWRSWWHWATLALVSAALIGLVATAIVAHFGDHKKT